MNVILLVVVVLLKAEVAFGESQTLNTCIPTLTVFTWRRRD